MPKTLKRRQPTARHSRSRPLLARAPFIMVSELKNSMLREVCMKSLKTRSVASYQLQPIWCHHCRIRIAPYDLRTTVSHGKDYHRDCYVKIYPGGKAGKN